MEQQNVPRPRGVQRGLQPDDRTVGQSGIRLCRIDVQRAALLPGFRHGSRRHGHLLGRRRAAVRIVHHEPHLVPRAGLQEQHAAGEQIAGPIGLVVLIGHLVVDSQHRQRLAPIRLALFAVRDPNRCIAVAVAGDVPAEAQVLDCGRVDQKTFRFDAIIRRLDRKTGNVSLRHRLTGHKNNGAEDGKRQSRNGRQPSDSLHGRFLQKR
jgi:hypothetical protein